MCACVFIHMICLHHGSQTFCGTVSFCTKRSNRSSRRSSCSAAAAAVCSFPRSSMDRSTLASGSNPTLDNYRVHPLDGDKKLAVPSRVCLRHRRCCWDDNSLIESEKKQDQLGLRTALIACQTKAGGRGRHTVLPFSPTQREGLIVVRREGAPPVERRMSGLRQVQGAWHKSDIGFQ